MRDDIAVKLVHQTSDTVPVKMCHTHSFSVQGLHSKPGALAPGCNVNNLLNSLNAVCAS